MSRRKNGKRTPSGQPSRSKAAIAERQRQNFEEAPQQTVLKARRTHMRDFEEPDRPDQWRKRFAKPVSKDEMKQLQLDKRGSFLASLCADKKITAQELAAGEDHCKRYNEFAATHGLPRPTPQGPAYGAVRGGSRPENLRRARIAKAEWRRDEIALTHCSAGVSWAMRRACVKDEAAPVHLVVEGLQALIREGR